MSSNPSLPTESRQPWQIWQSLVEDFVEVLNEDYDRLESDVWVLGMRPESVFQILTDLNPEKGLRLFKGLFEEDLLTPQADKWDRVLALRDLVANLYEPQGPEEKQLLKEVFADDEQHDQNRPEYRQGEAAAEGSVRRRSPEEIAKRVKERLKQEQEAAAPKPAPEAKP